MIIVFKITKILKKGYWDQNLSPQCVLGSALTVIVLCWCSACF